MVRTTNKVPPRRQSGPGAAWSLSVNVISRIGEAEHHDENDYQRSA